MNIWIPYCLVIWIQDILRHTILLRRLCAGRLVPGNQHFNLISCSFVEVLRYVFRGICTFDLIDKVEHVTFCRTCANRYSYWCLWVQDFTRYLALSKQKEKNFEMKNIVCLLQYVLGVLLHIRVAIMKLYLQIRSIFGDFVLIFYIEGKLHTI